MKEVVVGAQGQFTAIVSDADWLFLRNWSWTFARSHPGGRELIYARRAVVVLEQLEGVAWPVKKRFDLFLHHVVLARIGFAAPPVKGWTADHINHNTLDNRRENLRWASPSFQAKRQRSRAHGDYVQQALAAMLAKHTLPVVYDAPSIVGLAPAPAFAGVPF